MKKNISILVVGSINADLIAYTNSGSQRANYAYGSDFEFNLGGKSLNVALTASTFTEDIVLISRVGNDIFGLEILERLAHRGLVTQYIKIDQSAHTGVGHVRVDEHGQYDTIVINGANWNLEESDVEAFLSDGYIPQYVVFNFEANVQFLKKIIPTFKALGSKIVMNFSPIVTDMRELLSMVDIAVMNLEEAQQILDIGDEDPLLLLRQLKSLGPEIVVITQGADGSVALNNDGGLLHVPAEKASVKNTVGAGDGFLACLVYSLGIGIDLEQSMINATWVGEIICSKREASLDNEDVFTLNSEATFVGSIVSSVSAKG